MALFITFEGGDGTGKTSQAAVLERRLADKGRRVLMLREPGGTPLGDYLRQWLKSADRPLTPEAELLLFAAARAELVRTVVRPALETGVVVVLDRYADSTVAYQGYGRRLPLQEVRRVNGLATGGLVPDLTVLLDVPPAVALHRAANRGTGGGTRFEDTDPAFHQRVYIGFRRLARRDPERWLVVDASAPQAVVAGQVWERVSALLTSAGERPAPAARE